MMKKYPAPVIKIGNMQVGDFITVTYPVSYRYNGGIIICGKWYERVEVPEPIVPDGYELHGIGIGLNLNAIPPIATASLKRMQ